MITFVKMTKQSYDKAMQTISEQSSQIAILREALGFYASPANWELVDILGQCAMTTDIDGEDTPGKRARDALLRAGKGEEIVVQPPLVGRQRWDTTAVEEPIPGPDACPQGGVHFCEKCGATMPTPKPGEARCEHCGCRHGKDEECPPMRHWPDKPTPKPEGRSCGNCGTEPCREDDCSMLHEDYWTSAASEGKGETHA